MNNALSTAVVITVFACEAEVWQLAGRGPDRSRISQCFSQANTDMTNESGRQVETTVHDAGRSPGHNNQYYAIIIIVVIVIAVNDDIK